MKPKVGMYLLIKPELEYAHFVKVGKIEYICDGVLTVMAITFTGDGRCPDVFSHNKTFAIHKDEVNDSYTLVRNESEVLAKVL